MRATFLNFIELKENFNALKAMMRQSILQICFYAAEVPFDTLVQVIAVLGLIP